MTPLHLSKTELYARGWTPALVTALLGEPDLKQTSRRGSYEWTSHLYAGARVSEAETTPEFAKHLAAGQARQAKLDERKQQRTAAYLEQARTVALPVTLMPLEALTTSALANYNSHCFDKAFRAYERGDGGEELDRLEPVTAESAPAEFAERLMVNYVRHRLTHYDRLLRVCDQARVPTKAKAEIRAIIKRRVLEAIAKTYPRLAAECARQAGEVEETL